MKMESLIKRYLLLFLLITFGLTSCDKTFRIPRLYPWETYKDKVKGAWLGQMVGVSFGEHFNLRWQNRMVPFEIDDYLMLRPDVVAKMNRTLKRNGARNWTTIQHQFIDNRESWTTFTPQQLVDKDDLFLELLYLFTLNRLPLFAIQNRDFAEDWLEYLQTGKIWHASKAAHSNFSRGVWPPESGLPENNPHCEDVDFQISSEIIGLVCPGLPKTSNIWSDQIGSLMCSGDGITGGTFVAGMITGAFFEDNVDSVVAWSLRCIPGTSTYAEVIREVIQLKNANEDWQQTWQAITEKWGENDTCPQGESGSFNVSARLNGAYVIIGLLYGKKDFGKTLEIVTRCGQNSEGNAATAAGVLGCILGADGIPEKWVASVKKVITNNAIREIYPNVISVDELVNKISGTGLKFVQHSGGKKIKKFKKEFIIIPYQIP